MKKLRIKKEFWDAIVSGEKKYEIRKLSKGYTAGIYKFVDSRDPKKIFGTVELNPYLVNPMIINSRKKGLIWLKCDFNRFMNEESAKLTQENYIDKNIDYIVYNIYNIKKRENNG